MGDDHLTPSGPDQLGAASLHACLGTLVSLLALPSLCQDRSPHEVLEVALDALWPVLDFDLGYIRVDKGEAGLEAWHAHGECPDWSRSRSERCDTMRRGLEPHLRLPPPPPGNAVELPEPAGRLQIIVIPLGFYGDTGMMLLGARRPTFPTAIERIHGRAAGSLLTTAIESSLACQRLEAARSELEVANRAKDEFLAMLGHELRNPLAPIVTALQLLDARGHAGHREYEIIARQVEHMRQLVDDLLDIARITRGTLELKPTTIEFAEIVDKALEMASPLLERRRHHLDVDCPRRGLAIEGDPVRCAQILANLLTNAAKFTPPDGRIQLRARRDDDQLCVEVIDNGIGISSQMLPRVFDQFEQAHRSVERSEGGLGLGLAIVKSLVELHGGRVEADSAGPGCGARFSVRLPLSSASRAASDDTTHATGAREAPGDTRIRGRLVIVDDNRDAAELLAEILALESYEVALAHDGALGLELVRRVRPCLVLLDIGLPVLDGYEVARRVRSDDSLADTRLVAVTGYGQPNDRDRTAAAGFDAHLVKPVALEDLLETLDELLGAEVPA